MFYSKSYAKVGTKSISKTCFIMRNLNILLTDRFIAIEPFCCYLSPEQTAGPLAGQDMGTTFVHHYHTTAYCEHGRDLINCRHSPSRGLRGWWGQLLCNFMGPELLKRNYDYSSSQLRCCQRGFFKVYIS